MKNFLFAFVALGAFSLLAAGPANAYTPSETFKLYANTNHQVTGCDVYTQLVISYSNSLIEVSERVGGLCALAIMPDTRVYAINSDSEVDGVRVISASRAGQSGTESIRIWDYRGAPWDAPSSGAVAPLIVTEYHNQKYSTYYSSL